MCTVTVTLALVFSALHLENDNLLTLYEWVYYFTNYFCTLYCWCAYRYGSTVVNQKNLVKLYGLTFFSILNVVNKEFFALFNLELLTVNISTIAYILFIINGFLRKARCFVLRLL